ncbi:MAG: hypothetical protein WA624_14340 [Methylocella sp.]
MRHFSGDRFGKEVFCGAANCLRGGYLDASVRHGFRLFLNLGGRAFGQLRHRPRIRLGGRCEAPAIGANPSSRESIEAGGAAGSWRLARTATATAAKGEAAVLHTADFERSDPRLAGLMLRCGREGVQAVLVAVEPFPPHARPQITLRTPGQESQFIGTIISTGAGIRLPSAAKSLVTGPWRTPPDLEKKVAAGGRRAECVQK